MNAAYEKRNSGRPLTVEEIKTWPVTIGVQQAATALGISRSAAHRHIQEGIFPLKTVKVGKTYKILTVSLIQFLEG